MLIKLFIKINLVLKKMAMVTYTFDMSWKWMFHQEIFSYTSRKIVKVFSAAIMKKNVSLVCSTLHKSFVCYIKLDWSLMQINLTQFSLNGSAFPIQTSPEPRNEVGSVSSTGCPAKLNTLSIVDKEELLHWMMPQFFKAEQTLETLLEIILYNHPKSNCTTFAQMFLL